MSAAFQYGIANTDSPLKFPKFNGDPAKYREFKNNLCLALNAKGIVPPKTKGESLFNIKMAHYASTRESFFFTSHIKCVVIFLHIKNQSRATWIFLIFFKMALIKYTYLIIMTIAI